MKACRAALSRLGLFLCFFASICVAYSATATEDIIPYYRQSQSAELKSPLDSVNLETFPEPHGLRLGKLIFNPYETEDATYTDNPRRTEKSRLDDILFESAAGFSSGFRPVENVRLALNYEFGWHDYELKSVQSYSSQQAGFSAILDRVFVEGLGLSFTEQYLQTGNTSALENEIAQLSKYQSNRAAMRAAYSYNHLKFSGEYSYSLIDYFDRVNSFSNFRTHTGNLEVAWELLRKRFEIFDSFQLQRTLYDHDAYSDFDSFMQQVGVRGVYSRLSYSVSVGYVYEAPIFHTGVRGDSSFNANLTYTPHRRLAFDVSGSRSFVPDVRSGATLESDIFADMKITLTPRGKVSLSYTRNQSDRLAGDQQISIAYSSRFDYKITRNAAAIFSYTRYERASTLQNNSFIANEVRLGFKLAW